MRHQRADFERSKVLLLLLVGVQLLLRFFHLTNYHIKAVGCRFVVNWFNFLVGVVFSLVAGFEVRFFRRPFALGEPVFVNDFGEKRCPVCF